MAPAVGLPGGRKELARLGVASRVSHQVATPPATLPTIVAVSHPRVFVGVAF
jgi:hypothetical protein